MRSKPLAGGPFKPSFGLSGAVDLDLAFDLAPIVRRLLQLRIRSRAVTTVLQTTFSLQAASHLNTVNFAPSQSAARINPLRLLAAVSLLAIAVGILSLTMKSQDAGNRDYITYWAAGHQLIHRANPYDGQAILRLEKNAGFQNPRPFFMRNPPYAFFLALPLGLVGATAGAVCWSVALVAALAASVRMLWILHGRPPDRTHLIAYLFPPVLACLFQGQIGIFILLGVTLFLYLHRSQPYLAGTALLLCALKPHLFLPFGAVLLAWIVATRAYRILLGASAALLASLALSFYLDPAAWSHYAHMARAANLQDEFIPTMSLVFRLLVHRGAAWLQFVPAFAAVLWALRYFLRHRAHWRWMDHGLLLLLVSVLVAPYAWFTDEVLVLPAILAALYRLSDAGRSLVPFACLASAALIELFALVHPSSGYYLWTAPAWFAWYIYAVRSAGRQAPAEAEDGALDESRRRLDLSEAK